MFPIAKQPLKMELDLPPKSVAALAPPVEVSELDFLTRVPLPAGGFVRESSILSGRLHVDGPTGRAIALQALDSLVLGKDRLRINTLTFSADSSVISVNFSGAVSSLSLGRGEHARNEMPTWLDRLTSTYAVPSLLVGAAIAAGLAFLIISWRRRRFA